MAMSMLCIIAFIVTRLLVGVRGAEIGDECTADPICNEGSCIDGVCQLSTKSEIKCGNVFCQPNEECSTIYIRCAEGYTCETERSRCVVKRYNPCKSTTCLEGYYCIPSEENPTIADCILRDPCSTIRCKAGYTCNVVILNCLVAPCPPPYGECVATNPCASTTCLEGNICTQKKDYPSVAECVLNPCAISLCMWGTTCQPVIENCRNPPCSFPIAQCVSDEDYNPCALVDCRSGYTCTNVLVDNYETSPSPKFRAACEPR